MALKALNALILAEISRIERENQIDQAILNDFAQFVIANHRKKDPATKVVTTKPAQKIKPLTLPQLKAAVYGYFGVSNTTDLKKSGSFQNATDGMGALNLARKDGWELIYRKLIGILPDEENETGYGCINGINIFKYFRPWQVFGLDRQTAKKEDVQLAYRNLSKLYHPDVQETGDAAIFDRLNSMYQSLLDGF